MSEKKKAPKLPEAGQWPDRIAPAVLVAGIVLSTVGCWRFSGPRP